MGVRGIAFSEDPAPQGKKTGLQQQRLVHRISHSKPEEMPSEGLDWQGEKNLMCYFERTLATKMNHLEAINSFAMHLQLGKKPLHLLKSSNINEQHRWAIHYCKDAIRGG